MKKTILLTTLLLITTFLFSQTITNSLVFIKNPARFDNKTISLTNVEIVNSNAVKFKPGERIQCNIPKGYKRLNLVFTDDFEYNGCFYTNSVMSRVLEGKTVTGTVPAIITIQGSERMGYNVIKVRPIPKKN